MASTSASSSSSGGLRRRRRSSGEGEEEGSRRCEKKAMVRPRKKIVCKESNALDLRSSDDGEEDRRAEVEDGLVDHLEDHLVKLKIGKKQQRRNDSLRSKANKMERDE